MMTRFEEAVCCDCRETYAATLIFVFTVISRWLRHFATPTALSKFLLRSCKTHVHSPPILPFLAAWHIRHDYNFDIFRALGNMICSNETYVTAFVAKTMYNKALANRLFYRVLWVQRDNRCWLRRFYNCFFV